MNGDKGKLKKWIYYNPHFEFEKQLQDEDSAWSGFFDFAYDLVGNIKPKMVVELGTHRGHSFFSFAQAVKDMGLSTKLYAIDSWEGDSHAGFYGVKIYEGVRQIVKKNYPEVDIILLKGYFQGFVKDFKDNSIDILHIDGLHTYEAVKTDFEAWLPKMNKNGVILIHDISEKKTGFGVFELWSELENSFNTLSMEHSHGLGIVCLNDRVYGSLKSHEEMWRNYYLKCYQILLLRQRVSEVERVLSQTKKDFSNESQKKEERIDQLNIKLNKIEKSRTWKLRNKLANFAGKDKI